MIVGSVIDIRDIITFQGASDPEFDAAFTTAVDGYIHACEQLGHAAEKPASSRLMLCGRLMLRVSPALQASAVNVSARSGQSLNKWAVKVLGGRRAL